MRLLAQVAKRFLVILGLLGVTGRGLLSLCFLSRRLGASISVVVRLVSIFLVGDPLAGARLCRTVPGGLLLLPPLDEQFLVISGHPGVTAGGRLGLCLLSQLSAVFSGAGRPVSLSFI